jgi:hypothetical protein
MRSSKTKEAKALVLNKEEGVNVFVSISIPEPKVELAPRLSATLIKRFAVRSYSA